MKKLAWTSWVAGTAEVGILCALIPVVLADVAFMIGAIEAYHVASTQPFLPRVDPWNLAFFGALSIIGLYLIWRSASAAKAGILGGARRHVAELLCGAWIATSVLALSLAQVETNSICLDRPCGTTLGDPKLNLTVVTILLVLDAVFLFGSFVVAVALVIARMPERVQ